MAWLMNEQMEWTANSKHDSSVANEFAAPGIPSANVAMPLKQEELSVTRIH